MIKLDHPFKDKCDVNDLLNECVTIDRFCSNLESQAKDIETKLGPELGLDAANKFRGDGLECLVEFWIKSGIRSNFLNIRDYIIITKDDTGVDGRGISTLNSRTKTVQVKYRGNPTEELEANKDHLTNFTTASLLRYGVLPSDSNNMLIITTGKGLYYFTKDDMLCGKVQCIGREVISKHLDNQTEFWVAFKQALVESRIQSKPIEKIVLRQHQLEAVEAVLKTIQADQATGYVELPTSTGKTLIQAEVIRRIIVRDLSIPRCFAVFSPRILLSFQLLKKVCEYLRSHGVDAEYLNVNSGDLDEESINRMRLEAGFDVGQVLSTTSSKTIKEVYDAAKAAKRTLIISSTYHSADRIQTSGIDVDLGEDSVSFYESDCFA